MAFDRVDVETRAIDDAASRVGDSDHPCSCVAEQPCGVSAGIAEALDGDGRPVESIESGQAADLQEMLGGVEETLRGGSLASGDATELHRFARDDRQIRVSRVHHRIRVVDPGHGLGVGVQVRGRDVGEGSDRLTECSREASSDPFLLSNREEVGVADDAAFGTPERHVEEGTLPAHPRGQCLDLVRPGLGMEPDAALTGTADDGVEHPIALEDVDVAVVEVHRHGDLDDPIGLEQPFGDSLPPLELVGERNRSFELLLHDVMEIQILHPADGRSHL